MCIFPFPYSAHTFVVTKVGEASRQVLRTSLYCFLESLHTACEMNRCFFLLLEISEQQEAESCIRYLFQSLRWLLAEFHIPRLRRNSWTDEKNKAWREETLCFLSWFLSKHILMIKKEESVEKALSGFFCGRWGRELGNSLCKPFYKAVFELWGGSTVIFSSTLERVWLKLVSNFNLNFIVAKMLHLFILQYRALVRTRYS